MKMQLVLAAAILIIIGVISFLYIYVRTEVIHNQATSSSTISHNISTDILPPNASIIPGITPHNTRYEQNNPMPQSNQKQNNQGEIPSCGSNYTIFSTPLFDPDSVVAVLPLADLIPPDHVFPTPHSYIYTSNPSIGASKDGAYFYAPADMVLTGIALRNLRNTPGVYKNYTDYTLIFQPCREFYLYFHNVASLLYQPFVNASLQAKETCGDQSYCQIPTMIPIAAGQPIGTIGNSIEGIQGLDIGARDYRLPDGRSAFIDPDRLCSLYGGNPNIFDRCYAVCPYDYFTKKIKDTIHLSSADRSIAVQGCGSVYQDVNGTAKGYWFPANRSTSSFSPEATDLFMGQSTIQPDLDVFSTGFSVPGLPAGLYEFLPHQSNYVNRDFRGTAPGNIYCYEVKSTNEFNPTASGQPTLVYLELLNKSALLIEGKNASQCGNGAWSIGPEAAKFVR